MAVADGSRLIARLHALVQATELTPYALPDIAQDVIEDVQASAASNLANAETYQVGFDLGQFQQNIADPGPLSVPAEGVGHIGILDVEKMGTVDDFDAINFDGEPLLFHRGKGDRSSIWREIIYPNAALREQVSEGRRAVWGSKTPQWFLLNDGYTGNGAYPDTPATHFIEEATHPPTVLAKMLARFERMFKGL